MKTVKFLYRVRYHLSFGNDLHGDTLYFKGDITGLPDDFGQKNGDLHHLKGMVIELLDKYLEGEDRTIKSIQVEDHRGSLIVNE